jgi:RNA polymerase sigma-70 factor (ECF subfamily)
MRRENARLLWSAIGHLPCKFRRPVELRYLYNYSTAQVADELGISLSAAKTRLMRARKSAQRRLPRMRVPRIKQPISRR